MIRRPIAVLGALGLAVLVAVAGCGGGSATPPDLEKRPPTTGSPGATATQGGSPATYTKVLVIPEENKSYGQVMGSRKAPYLNRLATTYGAATNLDAGYPTNCPSLPAYLLMTSGSTHGICDDGDAPAHRLAGDNLFQQLAASGRQWRTYAESMPAPCAGTTGNGGRYLPRHAPAPYYVSEEARCQRWDVPLGTVQAGPLHDDLAAGRLPAYSMVTPDACHDMHGAPGCDQQLVTAGDAWLARWIPTILASPDYTNGRLVVVITWDEGSKTDNHIPTVVVSPSTTRIAAIKPYTLCSVLRTVEEILKLPLLGCARTAPSARAEFRL